MNKECPKCKRRFANEAVFCNICGTALVPTKRKNHPVLKALLVLIGAALLLGTGLSYLGSILNESGSVVKEGESQTQKQLDKEHADLYMSCREEYLAEVDDLLDQLHEIERNVLNRHEKMKERIQAYDEYRWSGEAKARIEQMNEQEREISSYIWKLRGLPVDIRDAEREYYHENYISCRAKMQIIRQYLDNTKEFIRENE